MIWAAHGCTLEDDDDDDDGVDVDGGRDDGAIMIPTNDDIDGGDVDAIDLFSSRLILCWCGHSSRYSTH